MRELHMIYARCFFYEMVMVVTGPFMDLLDRHRLGRTRLYAVADGFTGACMGCTQERQYRTGG